MQEPVHIMIDNETLSVLHNAHIAQVGLVQFDPHTFTPLAEKVISISHDRQPGTVIDASTVDWWMARDKETQQSVFYGDEDRISIRSACCEFYRFVIDSCRRTWQEDETPGLSDLHQFVHIWAKPARFDIPQWENAFRHADVQVPWFRCNVNDVQSLLNDAERNGFVSSSLKHLSTGIHMPLNDCLWQIRLLKAITEFKSR